MPPYTWTIDPIGLSRVFEKRHESPEAGTLLAWARHTLEALHYLDDIDRAYDVSHEVDRDHPSHIVEVAHARWATSTCITALDLCAAGLGRSICGHKGERELDLADFDANRRSRKNPARRAQLPELALKWVDDVCADADYGTIKDVRNTLVHSQLPRHFILSAGGLPRRLELKVGEKSLSVRYIVELARDVATQHVVAFFEILERI